MKFVKEEIKGSDEQDCEIAEAQPQPEEFKPEDVIEMAAWRGAELNLYRVGGRFVAATCEAKAVRVLNPNGRITESSDGRWSICHTRNNEVSRHRVPVQLVRTNYKTV